MATVGWFVTRALARLCVWAYYRLFRVEGADRVPRTGPVLLVANHPNSLVDSGVVMCAVPRPVAFVARRRTLTVPLVGWLLRTLGLAPVIRLGESTPETRRDRKLLSAFARHLERGGAAVLFPEGHAHHDPELKAIRPGAAGLALDAEAQADFELGLRVVPVGLHYEPKQTFRGEVHVRVGEPFEIRDLKDVPRPEAVQEVQARIAGSLRPLVAHLDRVDLEPLVQGVADVYDEVQGADAAVLHPRPRGEIVHLASDALNHFLVADPSAVERTREYYAQYQQLTERTGIDGEAVEARARPVRAWLGFLATLLGAVVGFPVFLLGCLTGYLPYRLTDVLARRLARRRGPSALPRLRIVVGAVVFGLFWGLLAFFVGRWADSVRLGAVAFGIFVLASLYARFYASRVSTWRDRLGGLHPLGGSEMEQVAQARTRLLEHVQDLARRYGEETGAPLLPPRRRRWHQRVPWYAAAAVVLVAAALYFLWGLKNQRVKELPDTPSPWAALDTERARATLEDDARTLTTLLDTLTDLETKAQVLKTEFDAEAREFTTVADDQLIRSALLTYLSCRSELFRLAWFYRSPDRPGEAELSDRAFALSYAAALELVRRGMQLVTLFADSPRAIRKLNEGDQAWGLTAGTYDRIRRNLSSTAIYDELAAASARYDRLRATLDRPSTPTWDRIHDEAARGQAIVQALAEAQWQFKWDAAVARAEGTTEDARYAASAFFAGLIGHVRVREGDLAEGLISDAQVVWLRDEVLEPGDIFLERRNWALSNVFLPGFWTHAALYVGGVQGVRELGIEDHEDVQPHLAALAQPDEHGHPRLVLEAVGAGVILNSLETSVGESDAVCVLRPRLPKEKIAAAVARALSHHGKPYDFDFDFFSSDKLVCTELVYRAYDGPLDFELVTLMGRETLPAMGILETWVEERTREDRRLDMVCFLDAAEDEGLARRGGEEELLATRDRPGIAFLREDVAAARWPRVLGAVLAGLFLVALVFLRRRN